MDNSLCKDCKHYMQHYGLDGKGFFPLYCGHCTHLRVVHRRPDQKGCKNFISGENREKAFASKEYLTKALLDWIATLPLLPEELQNRVEAEHPDNQTNM